MGHAMYTFYEAVKLGYKRGMEAVENCEVGEGETHMEAAFYAERNARQYAGHIPIEIQRDETLMDAYEQGVSNAIRNNT